MVLTYISALVGFLCKIGLGMVATINGNFFLNIIIPSIFVMEAQRFLWARYLNLRICNQSYSFIIIFVQ